MANVASLAQLAVLTWQLFDRGGVGLVNCLMGSSTAMREFGAQAKAACAVLSEDMIRAAEVPNDKLTISYRAIDNARIKSDLAFK